MHDPFPLSPPPFLTNFVSPLSTRLTLHTLPLHIHEILLSALTYHLIFLYLSPLLSTLFFRQTYPHLPPKTKLNWDVHVVSLCQSVFICWTALWVMWKDEERGRIGRAGWEERVWGYTGAGGMVEGFAAGYFVWDLWICAGNVGVFGWGLLMHAVAALGVYSLGFRPFVNYYAPTFILYELSSPFLNFHWFFDKLHMTGSRPQWYNGILLLSSFFCCRLCWGTYQSARVSYDVWRALFHPPSSAGHIPPSSSSNPSLMREGKGELMRFADINANIPIWLAVVYLGSNVVLNSLNFYWFGKMIETIRKRFGEAKGKGGRTQEEKEGAVMVEGLIDSSTLIAEVVGEGGNGKGELGEGEREVVEDRMRDENASRGGRGRVEGGLANGGTTLEISSAEVRRRRD